MFETLPPDMTSRWNLVREIVKRFRGKPRTHPAINNNTIAQYEATLRDSLPPAVREWYLLIGEIGDHWSGQDSMWVPTIPIIDRTVIPVMAENQNCFRMGYLVGDSDQSDPPVYRCSDGKPEFQLSKSVTEFAIQMLILETIWSGAHAHFDCSDVIIDGNQAKAIETEFNECGINDIHLWSAPIRFRMENDVMFRIDYDGGSGDYAYFGFAAESQDAFDRTVSRLSKRGIELVGQ